jgi:ankyrin repeat protein
MQALRIDHQAKRRRMFRFLLRRGANPNDADLKTGRNALMWCCALRRADQVKLLLEHSGEFDFSQTDHDGQTALHLAVQSMDHHIVELVASEMQRL